MTVMMKGQGKKTLDRFRGLSSTLAGVGEDGLDEVTLAVLAALLLEAAVVFFGVQNPVVVAPVACFSFSSFP